MNDKHMSKLSGPQKLKEINWPGFHPKEVQQDYFLH